MYLLDTNIVIFHFKGKHKVDQKVNEVGLANCFISEITLAELKFGAYKSDRPEYHIKMIEDFVKEISILPIFGVLDVYAKEKARLEREGNRIDDFDLLIGATAIANDFTLVTNNTSHMSRLQSIKLEDWVQKS